MTDIGLWPKNILKYVDYKFKRDIIHLQENDEELLKEKSFIQNVALINRLVECHSGMFKRKHKNGDFINRSSL